MWLSVDPLAEKYPNVSPYAYTFQNPVKCIDPRGLEGVEPGDPLSEIKEKEIEPVTIIGRSRIWFERNIWRPVKSIFNIKVKNSVTYEIKLKVDVGIMKIEDKGATGFEVKGPTITAGEMTIGFNKEEGGYTKLYNPLYEIMTAGELRGTIASGKVETGKVDAKAGFDWKVKIPIPELYIYNSNYRKFYHSLENTEVTPHIGVGRPWSELKIEKTNNGVNIKYGIQEDVGQSFYNIIGVKGDFRLEGNTKINW